MPLLYSLLWLDWDDGGPAISRDPAPFRAPGIHRDKRRGVRAQPPAGHGWHVRFPSSPARHPGLQPVALVGCARALDVAPSFFLPCLFTRLRACLRSDLGTQLAFCILRPPGRTRPDPNRRCIQLLSTRMQPPSHWQRPALYSAPAVSRHSQRPLYPAVAAPPAAGFSSCGRDRTSPRQQLPSSPQQQVPSRRACRGRPVPASEALRRWQPCRVLPPAAARSRSMLQRQPFPRQPLPASDTASPRDNREGRKVQSTRRESLTRCAEYCPEEK